MAAKEGAARPAPWNSEIAMAVVFGLVTSLFAVVVPASAVIVVAAVAALTVAGFFLRRYVLYGGRELALLAALAAVGVGSALAPPALAAEVVAGFSALVALLWSAADPRAPSSFRYRTSGIVLPGLAVAVAVIVSGVLPSTGSLVGVAAGLVIAVVFWIAYVLSRPEPFRLTSEDQGEPS